MEKKYLSEIYDMASKGYTSISNGVMLSCLQAENVLGMKSVNNEQCERFQEIVETQIGMLEGQQTSLNLAYQRCVDSFSSLKSAGYSTEQSGVYSDNFKDVNASHKNSTERINGYLERLRKLEKALQEHMKANGLNSSSFSVHCYAIL